MNTRTIVVYKSTVLDDCFIIRWETGCPDPVRGGPENAFKRIERNGKEKVRRSGEGLITHIVWQDVPAHYAARVRALANPVEEKPE